MNKQQSAPAPAPQFTGRIRRIRDLPIWTKLGLIMIVPTLATIVVGTAALLDQVHQATDVERARALTVLAGEAGSLVHALQEERAVAVALLVVHNPPAVAEELLADFRDKQAATNAATARYVMNRTSLADLPHNLDSLLLRIDTRIAGLEKLRERVAALTETTLSLAENDYTGLIQDLLEIRQHATLLTADTTLADRITAAWAIATQKEFVSQERIVVAKALARRDFSQGVRRTYLGMIRGQILSLETFGRVANEEQLALYDTLIKGPAPDQPNPDVAETHYLEGSLDGLRSIDPNSVVNPETWEKAMVGFANSLFQVEELLNDDALAAATDLGETVQRRVLMQTGLLLATLLLGILFAWLVARSMARSLRDLRQGALAVARYGLPQAVARLRDPAVTAHLSPEVVAVQIAEPLPVRSQDEFGQVTEAFNAVHLEAVRTAAEQAALRASVATMFVNLARRSQILVDRLIGHLDRLERGEQDPDRLSELFQLDHLATRMRRNDENLLVLAGFDSTRVQREPASLMDVLRAAQSEVEHYTRIEFAIIDSDIEIGAHAVNDMVHLVAELFDNATAFSPPDTSIRVEARRRGERAVLHVEDHGIGMSADQYAELNRRLATPPEVDVAVSRMMGLVVVARLAARHGVKVELRPARERGTLAEVIMPANVLVPRAMAGRAHAPQGFPAARPAGPGGPLLFPPPLALESGPSAFLGNDSRPASPWASAPQPATADAGHGFGGPPAAPAPGPSWGAPGAAPSAPAAGGARRTPPWADLTGAGEAPEPERPGGAHSEVEQLPRRRPSGLWGDSEAGAAPAPEAPPTWAGGPAAPPVPAPAASTLPPMPPPPGFGPTAPYPGVPSPRPDGGSPLGPGQLAGPGWAASPPPEASPGADDLTVELPIFRELESAWFRVPSAQSPPPPGSASWPPEAASQAGRTPGGVTSPGVGGYGAGYPEPSWQTVADDGWRAARAALNPRDGGTTEMGLPRRVPMAQLVPGGVEEAAAPNPTERRTPESVRGLLSAYTEGVQRGRSAHGRSPDSPDSSLTSGKEQES